MPMPRPHKPQKNKIYITPKIKSEDTSKYISVATHAPGEKISAEVIKAANGKVFIRNDIEDPENLKKQVEIIKKLNTVGIPTEQAFSNKAIKYIDRFDEQKYKMAYEGKGRSLDKEIITGKLSEKEIKNAIYQIADIIGKMHATGITHGHPHLGNFTVVRKNGKIIIHIIDFKNARGHITKNNWQRKYLKWEQNPYEYFKREISWINDISYLSGPIFSLLKNNRNDLFRFYRRIILHYPCSKEEKIKFLKHFYKKTYGTDLDLKDPFIIQQFRVKRAKK
jgi:serine/threonine protein kinase